MAQRASTSHTHTRSWADMRRHARPGSGGEGEAAWPDRVTVLERQAEAERIAAETEEARRPRVKAKRSQSALPGASRDKNGGDAARGRENDQATGRSPRS